LNVLGVNCIRQTEIFTTASLVPEPSDFNFEIAIEKFKDTNLLCTNQIPTELIKAVGRTIRSEIHKSISFYLE